VTCDEHLAWCKLRALEYVDAGELTNAVASMGSDMNKHPKTASPLLTHLIAVGMLLIKDGPDAVREWINGFI
jgi:hypothetical protein